VITQNSSTISDLITVLGDSPDLALKFEFNGAQIKPGYHVTEVKHASVNAIDCGKNSPLEQWEEITIQLLDGSSLSTQKHMTVAKFLAIVNAALNALSTTTAHLLFIEFAPDNGPIRKLSVESVDRNENEVIVSLGSEQAVCKPFERAKSALASGAIGDAVNQVMANTGCCSGGKEQSSSKGCCG
jgi:hypothetical protein